MVGGRIDCPLQAFGRAEGAAVTQRRDHLEVRVDLEDGLGLRSESGLKPEINGDLAQEFVTPFQSPESLLWRGHGVTSGSFPLNSSSLT